MTCTSATIAAPKPTISQVAAVDRGNGQVDLTWSQDIAGTIKVSMDNTFIQNFAGGAGTDLLRLNNVPAGTHSFCVDAA